MTQNYSSLGESCLLVHYTMISEIVFRQIRNGNIERAKEYLLLAK